LPWFITGVAVATVVFLGLIIALKFVKSPEKQPAKVILPTVAKPINAIVVLPFENLSGDPEQEYFVDGMTDALSAELGKIKALTIISRTSAMRYKNTEKSIPEIAKELGVDAVIEGSVLKAGNDVRITAQLVDGRTDAHLWSDNYTGTLTNILAMQSQVTLAIAREIEVALTPEEEVRITCTEAVNPEAYEAFLKGRFFFLKFTEAGFKSAVEYLEKAIEIDPNYAEAYARLAPAYWIPSTYGYATPHESFRKAKWAVDKAIGLDDSLSMAHYAAGWIALVYDWEWVKAEREFNLARQLNPNDPLVYQSFAWYSVVAGRLDEAVDAIQTALKLDPLSLMYNDALGSIYGLSKQFERAVTQYKNTLELDQNYLPSIIGLADSYAAMSRNSEAVAEIERAMNLAGRTPRLVTSLAGAYALSGMKEEAQTLLQELHKRVTNEYILPIYFAEVYASLGNTNEAIKWLKKAHEERNYGILFLRHDWYWNPLRSDPKFDDLLARMNFPETPDAGAAARPTETPQAPIEKIAVLPFTSISSEAGEEWFEDGMTVTLTTQLGKIKALTVISSRSAMELKGTSKSVREIARELGVDGLIEGTVIRVGDKVQITAELIDGRRDEQIWADIFQGTFDDILALQSQVTLAIAKKIEVALTPEEELHFAGTKPINPDAYEAFLKGQFFLDKRTEDGSKMAIHYFEQAIQQDSSYALAHAGLADCYIILGFHAHLEPNEAFQKAKREAQKALSIDNTLAEAHTSLAYISTVYEWDWENAESEFKRAIDLNPNYATAHHWYSTFLHSMGRYDEAIVEIKQAQKLDPVSNMINTDLGEIYHSMHQYDRAIDAFQNVLAMHKGFWRAHWSLAKAYLQKQMFEEALAEIQKAEDLLKGWQPWIEYLRGITYARMGKREEAEQLLNSLLERSKQEYIYPIFFADLHFALGENDKGFDWLKEAYKGRDPFLTFLKIRPVYDSVRSEPSFIEILKKMRLDK